VQVAAGEAAAGSQKVPPVTGTVAVNSASFEEFRGLGFSVTQTSRVLAQRERTGGFKSLDELHEIPGLPRSFLDQLKGRLTL
jgi:DNA uptake protein ComE-like DNA-binding protein